MTKLKKLGELVFPKGAIYLKFQKSLKEWKVAYKKRKAKGDDAVIEFINHFAELDPELAPGLKK